MESRADRFTALCAPYSGMLYRHCLNMLRHPQDAQDAAQETMLRAFRAYDGQAVSGVATWLFRIAHNICLDIIKSAAHRREQATLDEPDAPEQVSPGQTPEDAYLRTAQAQALREAISALPPVEQELLNLRMGEGMSYQELAKATGLREGTVKSRLNRAKKRLSELLPPDIL